MNKKLIFTIGIAFLLVVGVCSAVFFIKNNKLSAELIGKKQIEVDVFSDYKDKGIKLIKGTKILKSNKYKVKTTSNLNTSKLGKYTIKYTIKKNSKIFNLKRNITVVDKEPPVITTTADTIKRDYCTKNNINNIEYTATDNYDQDLTSSVQVKEEEDRVVYLVSDSSGNQAGKEVMIEFEAKPEDKFFLNGSDKETIVLGESYTEKGAKYTDGCGNELKGNIKISGNVDTSKEGTYTITYTLNGNKTITRTVNVKKYSPKTVYLTFDDGPGANTKTVLKTLAKYNVKATFFVTNQFPSYQYLIAEEYKAGHSIGVHTLTHKWNVYDSLEAYISDFDQMNEIIKNQTGSYTKIFRFPGGSGNTVSKSHSKGIVTIIADEMTKRGFVYYDWNLSSGDADSKPTKDKIISNVVNKIDNCRNDCVILFHDYKKVTAEALEPILSEITKRGYTFKTLDENGPVTHVTIRN